MYVEYFSAPIFTLIWAFKHTIYYSIKKNTKRKNTKHKSHFGMNQEKYVKRKKKRNVAQYAHSPQYEPRKKKPSKMKREKKSNKSESF